MNLRVKRTNPYSILPRYATAGAAAMDLSACLMEEPVTLGPGERALIPTGIAVALPVLTKPQSFDGVLNFAERINAEYFAKEHDVYSFAGMHPDFIPVKYNKDGSVSANSKKNLYTAEQWDQMMASLSKTVEDIANRMKAGEISALPRKKKNASPCEHCAYKAVCRNHI